MAYSIRGLLKIDFSSLGTRDWLVNVDTYQRISPLPIYTTPITPLSQRQRPGRSVGGKRDILS